MYVTQCLEHSTSVWKVIGSNSSQGHRLFFVPHSWHVDFIFSHFFTELKISHHSLYHCTNNVFIFHGDHSSHSLILKYYWMLQQSLPNMNTKETRQPECVQCITGEEILWNCMRTVSLGPNELPFAERCLNQRCWYIDLTACGITTVKNKTSCAPNSTFFKATFTWPKIYYKMVARHKILEARKKGVTSNSWCNIT